MKQYLNDLKNALKKNRINDQVIDEIIKDHEDMIRSAIEEGLSEEELVHRFGDPQKIADELSDFESVRSDVPVVHEYTTFKRFTPEEAYSVELKFVSEDIEFLPSEDEHIYIDYKGKGEVDKYEVRFDDNTLYMKAPDRKGVLSLLFLNRNTLTFRIRLPKQFDNELLKFSVVNGDVSLRNLMPKKSQFKTINGDMDITSMKLGTLKINTVNGDLKLTKSEAVDAQISLISGSLSITDFTCDKTVELDSVSGDMTLEKMRCEACDMSTVSGNVKGKDVHPKVISFSTISGDINIKNEDHEPVEIRKKTSMSGSINLSM